MRIELWRSIRLTGILSPLVLLLACSSTITTKPIPANDIKTGTAVVTQVPRTIISPTNTVPPTQTFLQPTDTVAPSPTPSPTRNPAQSDGLLGNPLTLQVLLDGKLILEDVNTGETRQLDPLIIIPFDAKFLGWTRQGCGFYAWIDGTYDIVEVDLRGNILRTIYASKNFNYRGPGETFPFVELSQSAEYIAFKAGKGERTEYPPHGYHWAMENLVVMPADGKGGFTTLSRHGGAWYYEWSPDSTALVFTDRDANGIFQVFVAKRDGSQRAQLTHFQDVEKVPEYLGWSPDGRYVAIVFPYENGGFDHFIANIEEKTTISLGKTYLFWWEEDGSFANWYKNRIAWTNPSDGSILKEMLGVPDESSHVNFFGSTHKFFCAWDCFGKLDFGMLVYDINTKSIT